MQYYRRCKCGIDCYFPLPVPRLQSTPQEVTLLCGRGHPVIRVKQCECGMHFYAWLEGGRSVCPRCWGKAHPRPAVFETPDEVRETPDEVRMTPDERARAMRELEKVATAVHQAAQRATQRVAELVPDRSSVSCGGDSFEERRKYVVVFEVVPLPAPGRTLSTYLTSLKFPLTEPSGLTIDEDTGMIDVSQGIDGYMPLIQEALKAQGKALGEIAQAKVYEAGQFRQLGKRGQ